MARAEHDVALSNWDERAAAVLASGRNPDGSIYSLPITTVGAELAAQDAVWLATARLAPGAGQVASWLINNPADSGITAVILAVRAWSDVNLPVRFVRGATSTGAAMTVINANLGNDGAPALTPVAGIDALTGGTSIAQAGVDPADHYERLGPLYLPPGISVALTIVAPGGLTGSADVAGSVEWAEQPAGA
jgi:hypothetical protein